MEATKKGLRGTEEHAKIRVLLTLWELGEGREKVKRSELNSKVQRKDENSKDYQVVYEQLKAEGAIELTMANRAGYVFLTDRGMQRLVEGLKNPDFGYDGAQVGSRVANALLKWIRLMDGAPVVSAKSAAAVVKAVEAVEAIASYEEFKSEILSLFEKLDKGYNYSGLVPIWHLRREIGERVSREEFNNWMMEMQGGQLLYLQSGEARGATDEQKRDAIASEIRGLLFYASKPS